MTPVLISSLLLIFCFTPRVESDIHSILRELDNSDLEESNNETERLNEYRKTLIKQEILNRLGLSSPPNISDSSFLPTQIIENVLLQRKSEVDEITKDVDAYYGVTKQVVVVAEQDKPSDAPGNSVLRFHTNFPAKSISSMLLGFHRDPRVLSKEILKIKGALSFRIIFDGQKRGKEESVFQRAQVTKTDRNWVVFNITKESLNIDIEDNSVKNITIQIVCNFCRNEEFIWSSDNKLPFLVLDVKPSNHKRVARSSRCNRNNRECCLVEYEVRFSDFGWDFIIAPDRISLNYCKGSCRGLGLLRQPRAHVLLKHLSKSGETGKSIKNSAPFKEPCCVVSKMSSVSIIFKTGPGHMAVKKEDIPNMRAVECECS